MILTCEQQEIQSTLKNEPYAPELLHQRSYFRAITGLIVEHTLK